MVATGFRGVWLPTWYPLKMRTFWAYFEEKQAKIAWVMAKTICFSKIWLCTTSCSCIFVVLHDSFHHKNYIGAYYTLYTIVYNWFYVKKSKKFQFFMHYDKIWFKLKKPVSVPVFLFWGVRQPVVVAGCPFLRQKTGPDRTCIHYWQV